MKLISLLDFVLLTEGIVESDQGESRTIKNTCFDRIIKYANFLKQPLTLGMFTAVDKHGVILEDLQFCCTGSDCGCMGQPVNVGSQEEINEYYEAKERVIFKDVIVRIDKETKSIYINGYPTVISDLNIFSIEDITHQCFELTDSAIKQIGL